MIDLDKLILNDSEPAAQAPELLSQVSEAINPYALGLTHCPPHVRHRSSAEQQNYNDPESASRESIGRTQGGPNGVDEEKGNEEVRRKHEDQWYHRNPDLLQVEIAVMHGYFPKAAYGFLKSSGNMYWLVTTKVVDNSDITEPWQFMITYPKDHPRDNPFIDGIDVIVLKPSLHELRELARRHGRSGIPNLKKCSSFSHAAHLRFFQMPESYEYSSKKYHAIPSAATMMMLAADWANHFLKGIRDKQTWNEWCDNDIFRNMQVE